MIGKTQYSQRVNAQSRNVLRWNTDCTRVDSDDTREYVRGMAAEPESVREYAQAQRDYRYDRHDDGGQE